MDIQAIEKLLGAEGQALLTHQCKTISKESLHLPGPDFVDRVWTDSDRPSAVLRNLQHTFNTGRLAGTGYLSILPVDQGIEHSAGASFAKNPIYFDPAKIVELAIEGGCNAVASTLGVLGACSRKYAHRIPFIVKINHNEFLTYPNKFDQVMFGRVDQAFDMGVTAALRVGWQMGSWSPFLSFLGGRSLVSRTLAVEPACEAHMPATLLALMAGFSWRL